ncbi:hypothetical protein T4D_1866 [Trichinella pseudospiralis]|uniref:Uncharacterized protein n=1 Tax=Trichinella pseudospiralis TaxID=6337 RepID=A0A0V1FG38_TRIPS|nr:hypothetical protein T4D_1866 [Trichinella pseudospiralis]
MISSNEVRRIVQCFLTDEEKPDSQTPPWQCCLLYFAGDSFLLKSSEKIARPHCTELRINLMTAFNNYRHDDYAYQVERDGVLPFIKNYDL